MIEKRLIDISRNISSGITPLRSNDEFWTDGAIPWLKTEQLGEKYIFDTNEHITEKALQEANVKIFPENTLSIAMYGEGKTRGNVSILKRPMATNQACCNIELDEERVSSEYVYYFLKTQYENLRGLSSGVRKNLNTNDIKNFVVRLPENLKTQQSIAAVLSTLDKKIALNKQINARLEEMAKTLYDYWFVQFDFPDANGKPYKSSGGEMVFDETLKREIPKGWEVKSLGEHITIKRGISYKSNEIKDTGVPFINLNSFYLDGKFKFEGTKFFTGKTKNDDFISSGDLLIAVTDVTRNADIIGKAFILPDLFNNSSVMSCDVAKISSSELNNFYLERLFNSSSYHEYIKYFASGTLVLHLDIKGISWFDTYIPPRMLLDKFEDFCRNIHLRMVETEKQNHHLTQLRDFLLPMLMNGQVSVAE
jgi:type I restriction-modification system specificity subunit